ncbi:MAG: transaldolase [Actinomycetia bacterium]|nr:transaldolase [Actinomycetes bacterium]
MAKYEKSAIQRLSETSEDMEIWWDSSPLAFEKWAEDELKDAPAEDKKLAAERLKKLFDFDNPQDTLFDGITTNPKLTRKVLDLIPEKVDPIVDRIIKENPAKSNYELAWEVYKAITEEGTKLFMPLFEKSGYKKGYVSAQVDPRLVTDVKEMLRQALVLKKISPNIMVKCPGSKEGIYVIEMLTSVGIPTNATLVFDVPQVVQVAEAVKRGYERGQQWGIDYSQWRSVITIMIGRFEAREPYFESAKQAGIELTEELQRWTGVAIAKKAHQILNDKSRGYYSKLLLCSSRVGPEPDEVLHIEKVAGGNMVYTINPEMISDFIKICDQKELGCQMDDPAPDEIMEKLLKIPYFVEGYEEDGIAIDDFIDQAAFQYTAKEFSGSMQEIEEYVQKRKDALK